VENDKGGARLPPTVVALGAVSLLNDVAGDMIHPLLRSSIIPASAGFSEAR
jgi:hypothetical protein